MTLEVTEVHWLVYKGTIYLKMAYVPLGHNYRVVNFVKVACIRDEVLYAATRYIEKS